MRCKTIIGTLLIGLAFSLSSPINTQAMSVAHQHHPALTTPNLRHYKTVYNTNHFKHDYKYVYVPKYLKNPFETQPNHIDGTHGLKFQTSLFLPGGSGHVHHYNNPQAVTVTPDGHYAFVAYNNSVEGRRGWVARYDLKQLQQLGITTNNMDLLRRVFSPHHHHHPMTQLEKQVQATAKVGPKFRMGHGQSLAYNPRTHQLWILGIGPGAQNYANAQRISTHTLKPVHKIKFTFSRHGDYYLNDVLAFDKRGYAYSYVYSGNNKRQIKKGTVKIYRGKISDHHVHFKLIMQGIRHAPGDITQSMGYNPTNNRLYLVSDGSILSFPAAKVGHLKKREIKWYGFHTRREFEGLSFDETGKSYLLVNRGVELLTSNQKW